ncbi:hypothetical protein POM88_038762 [Heracleum sosnowskyi]|uniref:F-box/kelch-repeat protein n=1 Tax=Heracleum sosnowskyi TaxID=360622 RepID=A0AAD8HA68_9APIA|nr:hypothetical protein POM88_038762 [Heracleum sosnowskyi]
MGVEEVERSSATSVAKDKIFLHVLSGDAGGFQFSEFYTLDMRNGQVSECPYALLADSGFNSMVSVGSVIYVIGCLRPDNVRCIIKPPHSRCTKKGHYHNFMSYLDLANDTGDGWKEAPGLSDGPSPSPAVVTFGGKIYLFECCGDAETAHVFDPISNEWETLLPPPGVDFFNVYYATSAVADSQNNRILVHIVTIQSVYAYYPANNRWELVLKPFFWSSRLVFVDGVIFFYLPEAPELFAAYHVATKQWLNIVFTSRLPEHIWRKEYDAFFHLGSDIMCLAAYSPDYSPRRTHVYLIKFRFERSPLKPADLLITMLPEETYTIGACSSVHRSIFSFKTAHLFDPVSNKWETLLPPPGVAFFDSHYATSAIADSENNRILVHFRKGFLINSLWRWQKRLPWKLDLCPPWPPMQKFDWKLPDGRNREDLDMSERPSAAAVATSCCC